MSSLEIEIENGRTAFRPGEEIRGRVQWQFQEAPERLELSLFWRTQGKGTRDTGIVKSITFEHVSQYGQKDFTFTAPEGPYSFSGRLISIIWGLELVEPARGKDYVRREIVISPSGQEVVCTESISDSGSGLDRGRFRSLFRQFRPEQRILK